MATARVDHDLLVEALAIHLGFVTRQSVEQARKTSGQPLESSHETSLAKILTRCAGLSAERADLLELLASDLLACHDGNLRQCLHALSAFGRLRHDLERRLAGLESRNSTVSPRVANRGARGEPRARPSNGRADPEFNAGVSAAGRTGDDPGIDEDGDDPEAGNGDASVDEAAEAKDYEWTLRAPHALGNRFQLLHPHARGGIGVVSVAFDCELQREVALKQIKTDSADDPDSRSRFLLEAEVTGRLEHPGIVPVYGLGYDDQGHPYYAMRFVHGITLEEAITRFHASSGAHGGDPRERALELRHLLGRFVNVCHTMAYAHSRGVLHRDLKPANVLLGPYNETLIVDWGLAKVLHRDARPLHATAEERGLDADGRDRGRPGRVLPPLAQSSSTETVAGAAFGTPAFMSPEQAEGLLERLGPASDVYSLGAMLYTLLCGRPPFEYAWCEVTTLLARVKNGEFAPPRQINPRVPRALESICLKAMARVPEQRYATAEDLATDIERWLGDEPVGAYREPRVGARPAVGPRASPTGCRGGRAAAGDTGRALSGRPFAGPRPA